MQNWGFDDTFKIPAVETSVFNPITGTLDRMVQPGETLPISGLNPSSVLGYDGNGNMITITKTINSVQYRKTLTYDGTNRITDIGLWVQL